MTRVSSIEDARLDVAPSHDRHAAAPLTPIELFHTLPELAVLLARELEGEQWLDAYLLAAAMSQLVDDQLQADVLSLRRIGGFLGKLGPRLRAAASLARATGDVLDALATRTPGAARMRRLQLTLDAGLDALADRLLGAPRPSGAAALESLATACEESGLARVRLPRALRREIARLPSCFRCFDQHPDDLRAIVEEFDARQHGRPRAEPLLVLGVRTSGSYLAPLYGALLRVAGWRDVAVLSVRPGRRPHGRERERLRAVANTPHSVLVCDDPPATGGSIEEVLADLRAMKVAPEAVTLLLALFEPPPAALARYEAVTLPFERWSVHERMRPGAVRAAVAELLGDDVAVLRAEPLESLPRPPARDHLRASYRLLLSIDGEERERDIRVEGVGIGYLGRHAIAVGERVGEFLPEVLGVRDGLLFRELLAEEGRADRLPAGRREALAPRVAAYVLARNRRLAVKRDSSLRMSGQYPAWEAASMALSRTFGRAWPIGRVLATDRIARRVMAARSPSVIDGRLEARRWFEDRESGQLVKVQWDQGCSWNLGLASCDPVFDLAGVSAASADRELDDEVRAAWQQLAGEPVESERWLLSQLAHLARPELRHESRHQVIRARSRALQRYYHDVYLADLECSADGPLCGLDIDGVLEGEYLGAPALTPASALGLRALHAHGYRPLLVTGRSLDEVIERTRAYRLAGGVAEYGSVIYEAATDRITVRLDQRELAELARVRSALGECEGVTLDEDHTYAIRAWRRDQRGRRRALEPALVERVLELAGAAATESIAGDAQTDFVAASVDKGRAVLALAEALGRRALDPSELPLALAVGDTQRDASLLALGALAAAPRHARAAALGPRVSIMRASYQAGFAEAVGRLIGHRPGDCERCRLAQGPRERRLVLAQLAVPERGIRSVPLRALRLAVRR